MFNLIDDPWIPIRNHNSVAREVGLRELFAHAPRIPELSIGFPLEFVATLRMLLAVLQSAVNGPTSVAQKARWMDEHAGLRPAIDAYLNEWHARFELFDPERPFLQQVIDPSEKTSPISVLRPDWASGNNATLFDHHLDAVPASMSPGAAVRALLTTLLFQPGGGVSKPFNRADSPGTKMLHAFVERTQLWEVLVLNAPVLATTGGRPAWERDADHVPDQSGTTPDGWLDRVTWRSRAVQLLCDQDGLVRTCRLHQHLKMAAGPPYDPFAAIRRKEGEAPDVLRAKPAKALWRDAEALVRALRSDADHATVVGEATRALEERDDPLIPQVRVIGQVVNQAKLADLRDGRMPMSFELLADDERLAFVGSLITVAEDGAKALRGGINAMAQAHGSHDGWDLARRWEASYWAEVAPGFDANLGRLSHRGSDAPSARLLTDWVHMVKTQARQAYVAGTDGGARDGRSAQAQAVGRRTLERNLSKIKEER